jgi:hypothetical protein
MPAVAKECVELVYGAELIHQWSGVTIRSEAASWLRYALQRLAELEAKAANWDGYGSPPITRAALRMARAIITNVSKNVPKPNIFPMTGGGIGISWDTDTEELMVEVLPEGSATYSIDAEHGADSLLQFQLQQMGIVPLQ